MPGFLSVKGVAQELRLAPRSVRDLIYAGRLPSVRLGRLHYVSVADADLERRRRLGLPLPRQTHPRLAAVPRTSGARRAPPVATPDGGSAGLAMRRARAAERASLRQQWLHAGRRPAEPALPFAPTTALALTPCTACGRRLAAGGTIVDAAPSDGRQAGRLCVTCARRTLLDWADGRRRESLAARRLAQHLGRSRERHSPAARAVA